MTLTERYEMIQDLRRQVDDYKLGSAKITSKHPNVKRLYNRISYHKKVLFQGMREQGTSVADL